MTHVNNDKNGVGTNFEVMSEKYNAGCSRKLEFVLIVCA